MVRLEDLTTDIGQEVETVVLMVTCWRFRQVWNPFFTLFQRYWSDCPYSLVMVTDTGSHPNISTIQMGSDCGWASNLLNALRQIDADRLIVFQEDFLLTTPTDTATVRKLVRYSRDNDIGCLRMCPCPGPSGKWRDEFLGTIGLYDPYRVSLQLAIWDRQSLMGLLREGESAWDLENKGGERSRLYIKPFLSLWRQPDDTPGGPVRYFITAVTRGVWEKGALELLGREGIPMDGITGRIL